MVSWILLAIVVALALLWGLPRLFRRRRDRHRRDLIRPSSSSATRASSR